VEYALERMEVISNMCYIKVVVTWFLEILFFY
jgi:hypothetical protein